MANLSKRKRFALVLLLALSLSGGAIAYGTRARSAPKRDRVLSSEQSRAPKDNQGNKGQDTKKKFTLQGSVTGLFPGGSAQIPVVITNPNGSPIDVTSIVVTVSNANAGCSGSHVTVQSFSGRLRVPKKGSASLTMTARLSTGAPDACQNATWPLTYRGQAVQA